MNGAEIIGWVGNLTRDPEYRIGDSGKAVTRFAVAINRRTGSGENASTEAFFVDCKAFGDVGEHIAGSVSRGDRVVFNGRMVRETWTHEGSERRRTVVYVSELGPSLLFATAKVERIQRAGRSGNGSGQPSAGNAEPAPAQVPAAVGASTDELDF